MTFLHVSLLAGAALVALPIVLHLIMRRRPRTLEFPAVRFLQSRHDVNRRRLRLRHLLLLLLRAAAIALLAAALARPSIKLSGALGSQEAPVAAVLVFDTAPRMQYRHENQSRLEAAGRFGTWLLAQLPPESQIAVLDSRPGPAAFQVDRGAARDRIERLQATAHAQPLPETLDESLRLLGQSELARKEIYVFTDLAAAAWPAQSAARLRGRLAQQPETGLYVVDVGVPRPVNFSLAELQLSAQVLSNRSSLEVRTQVAGSVDGGQRTVELMLLDADRNPQKRSERAIELAGGESRQIEFRVGGLEIGTHQGLVRMAGQDGLAEDDARYFTVEVKPAWRVLIAAPEPPARYAIFLAEALAPAAFRKQGRSRFECEVVSLDEVQQKPLEPYAAVCLLDPKPLPAATWQKLADFAAKRRGVAVFLGRNASPIDSFNEPVAQSVLAGKLLRQARRPDGDLWLAPRGYEHPVLSALGRQAGAIPWDAFPVLRYWELELPPEGTSVVLPLSDGRPAVLERSVGSGRALTVTTPVSDRPNDAPWNLLPVGEAWPFVILVNQMVSYLVGSTDEQFNYYAGQTAVLGIEPQSPHRSYLVTSPQGLKASIVPDPERHVLAFSSTEEVGNYRVQAGGQLSGVDRGFSVNLAPEQTRQERLPEVQLRQMLAPHDFRLVRDESQLDRAVSTARVGREMFPIVILLVCLALGLEQVVANRFYPEG